MSDLDIGMKAPSFRLKSTSGETVKLSDYKGRKVVLYFYPKDMTPTCTTQACDFRDYSPKFEANGAVILGISVDPPKQHQKFTDKYELPFLLLSDEDHKVSEKYGVWKLKRLYGREYMGIERTTFVIDAKGKIAKVWRKVRVKGHVEEVLAFVNGE